MRFISKVIVETSAEKAWQVVGEQYGEIGEWLSGLKATRLEGNLGPGAVRVCETSGFGPFPPLEIHEELVDFDPASRQFRYRATEGLPTIFRSAQNTWAVRPLDDDRCEVSWDAVIQLCWWSKPLACVLPWLMARDFRQVEEEMKFRIENDRPHPRKNPTNPSPMK